MPLSAATFCPTVNKIFGVYGPKVLQFNADSGALENSAIITGPAETTCGIVWHSASNSLYASVWNSMANQDEAAAHPQTDIFPIDQNTLAIGAGLGWTTLYNDGGVNNQRWPSGPRMLFDFGEPEIFFIGVVGNSNNSTWLGKIHPTIPVVEGETISNTNLWSEQASAGGGFCYFCRSFFPELRQADMNLAQNNTLSLVPDLSIVTPIAIEHASVNGKQYVVGGNQWMVRVDNWSPDSYVILNLDLVNAGSEPMRLRYRASDGRLYIPCQTTDGIILWEPTNDGAPSGTWWRGGFTSPIDVVFTGSKAFAVQNGPVSLKEIIV